MCRPIPRSRCEQQTLTAGAPFALGATHRASENTVPWFSIDGVRDEFYAAVMWSGAWSAGFDRTGASTVDHRRPARR